MAQTLQEFVQYTLRIAMDMLEDAGSLQFMIVGQRSDGGELLIVGGYQDDEQKRMLLDFARTLLDVSHSDRYAVITESWMSTPAIIDAEGAEGSMESFEKAYQNGQITRPSQDPQRREAIVSLCAQRDGQSAGLVYQMHRDAEGKVTSYSDAGFDGASLGGMMVALFDEAFAPHPAHLAQGKDLWDEMRRANGPVAVNLFGQGASPVLVACVDQILGRQRH